jgi:hypothetical protein
MAGNTNFRSAVSRANSHFMYWHYRRRFGYSMAPSFATACVQWVRRLAFEWLGIGNGA